MNADTTIPQFDLRNCLDRRFKHNGPDYSWRSCVGQFEVSVSPYATGAGTHCVHVRVRDLLTNLAVDDWSAAVRCSAGWRERLQEQVGKAMIRAQHRPTCPRCSPSAGERVPLLVKNSTRNRKQFFGCARFRGGAGCHFTLDIASAFDLPDAATHSPEPRTVFVTAAYSPDRRAS